MWLCFFEGLLSSLSSCSSHGRVCVSPVVIAQQRNNSTSSKIKVDLDQSTGDHYYHTQTLLLQFLGVFTNPPVINVKWTVLVWCFSGPADNSKCFNTTCHIHPSTHTRLSHKQCFLLSIHTVIHRWTHPLATWGSVSCPKTLRSGETEPSTF